MPRAQAFVRAADLGERKPVDSVILDYAGRCRRRATLSTLRGLTVEVDLAAAPALAHGDAYLLDDGRLVEVVAEAEALTEIRGRDPQHAARLAWRLGNHHVETEFGAKWLRIRRDPAIAGELSALGAKLIEIEGPFQPEGGAEALAAAHSHHDHHHHRHDHGHHDHDHHHAHHGHGHRHDHGDGHDHDHR